MGVLNVDKRKTWQISIKPCFDDRMSQSYHQFKVDQLDIVTHIIKGVFIGIVAIAWLPRLPLYAHASDVVYAILDKT